jgi:RNA polymerase sigma factor (sigma-70 family)
MIRSQIRNLIPGKPKRAAAAAAFATTHWSVVLAAQHKSPPPAAAAALEKLCRCYWRPIYSFVRRQGAGREDAEDLTQAFFARLLDLRGFEALRQEKGRLRSYLLVSLKHFLETEQRRAMAVKRGEGRKPVPLERLRANERVDIEPRDALSADLVYERRWALTVLERVLARLRSEYQTANRLLLFTRLRELLAGEPDRPSQADIASELSMTENALKQAFHRFRRRFKLLLREEIVRTVAVPGDVEDELRHLIAILRR